jgi:hypothetical protein
VKGVTKKRETGYDCASREVGEEINVDITPQQIEMFRDPTPVHRWSTTLYIVPVEFCFSCQVDGHEIVDYRWMTITQAMELSISNNTRELIRRFILPGIRSRQDDHNHRRRRKSKGGRTSLNNSWSQNHSYSDNNQSRTSSPSTLDESTAPVQSHERSRAVNGRRRQRSKKRDHPMIESGKFAILSTLSRSTSDNSFVDRDDNDSPLSNSVTSLTSVAEDQPAKRQTRRRRRNSKDVKQKNRESSITAVASVTNGSNCGSVANVVPNTIHSRPERKAQNRRYGNVLHSMLLSNIH